MAMWSLDCQDHNRYSHGERAGKLGILMAAYNKTLTTKKASSQDLRGDNSTVAEANFIINAIKWLTPHPMRWWEVAPLRPSRTPHNAHVGKLLSLPRSLINQYKRRRTEAHKVTWGWTLTLTIKGKTGQAETILSLELFSSLTTDVGLDTRKQYSPK